MNQKNNLAYPRALVHANSSGCWALAWRIHPDTGNHWDAAMTSTHYPRCALSQACDSARAMVKHSWDLLGRGTA